MKSKLQSHHRRVRSRHRQRGHLFLKVAAAAVVLLGVMIFFQERSRAEKKVVNLELQQQEDAKRQAKAKQSEDEQKAKREREALEEQANKAKKGQNDPLAQALKRFDDLDARFTDARKVAESTSRIALSQPVAALQALQREASDLQAPPCLEQGKTSLVQAMKETVDGYLVFMQNPAKMGAELAQTHLTTAETMLETYHKARATCPMP